MEVKILLNCLLMLRLFNGTIFPIQKLDLFYMVCCQILVKIKQGEYAALKNFSFIICRLYYPSYNANNFLIIYGFRDVIYANRLRNDRINKSLDLLNIMLEKKQYLIGTSYTLADICVATQLMPVLDQELGNMYPYVKVK